MTSTRAGETDGREQRRQARWLPILLGGFYLLVVHAFAALGVWTLVTGGGMSGKDAPEWNFIQTRGPAPELYETQLADGGLVGLKYLGRGDIDFLTILLPGSNRLWTFETNPKGDSPWSVSVVHLPRMSDGSLDYSAPVVSLIDKDADGVPENRLDWNAQPELRRMKLVADPWRVTDKP